MTATLLPNAKQQFLDTNGRPLAGGQVYFYIPNTSTFKSTWQDAGKTILNTNPVVLDSNGQAIIYGEGQYRQVVYDVHGNLIWDKLTDSYALNSEFQSFVTSVESSSGSSLIGFIQAGTGAVFRTVQAELRDAVKLEQFGAVGDGIADDTAAIQAALNTGRPIYLTEKTFCFTSLTGLARNGLTIVGKGSQKSVLKCTGTGTAINIDAFASGSASDPFIQGIHLEGFTIQGNANITTIWNMQGIARSRFIDINLREANAAGIGCVLSGVMLSEFSFIMCSQDLQPMASPPLEGMRIQAGFRAGVNIGNSSNNTFRNLYVEGSGTSTGENFGLRLVGADQNVFLGGSPESNYTYGLLIGPLCRMNTFIGMGFENLNSTADVSDAGVSSKYINCYSSQKFLLQGSNAEVSGGLFERIEIQVGAVKNIVHNVRLNHWNTGAGGFYDSGTATEWKNLYDEDASAYIYPLASRVGIAVGASEFQWTNNTGQYVEVVIQTGTLTQVRILRGSDSWLISAAVPAKHLLAPTDKIGVSYSGATPQMSYVPHNGFQG
jgi:hypothetical protein